MSPGNPPSSAEYAERTTKEREVDLFIRRARHHGETVSRDMSPSPPIEPNRTRPNATLSRTTCPGLGSPMGFSVRKPGFESR
jgi:hypothetical protein